MRDSDLLYHQLLSIPYRVELLVRKGRGFDTDRTRKELELAQSAADKLV